VVEVFWQPGLVRRTRRPAPAGQALDLCVIRQRLRLTRHEGDDESARVLPSTDRDEVDSEQYGEAKVACEQALL
jgi:2'-hydroxyisoflavone reductase